MERHLHSGRGAPHVERADGDDLERQLARARLDAVTARCVRLRTIIDDLEERLEM